ncbi:MAG: nucleoside phosphorylase [Bullifex sp.]
MGPDSFFDSSEVIISPENLFGKRETIADVCIVTFSKEVFSHFLSSFESSEAAVLHAACGDIPVRKFTPDGKPVLIYLSYTGAPASGAIMDEVRCMTGASRFIVFGSCGSLDSKATAGRLIVPTAAYRAEGFSYHFAPPSDYIEIKNHDFVSDMLSRSGYPVVKGKTWTTDAFYHETVKCRDERKKEGCICVEMEASALEALCDYRGVELYVFFFAGDLLDGETWDAAELVHDKQTKHQLDCFSAALTLAKELL